jgi:hypothetical protein
MDFSPVDWDDVSLTERHKFGLGGPVVLDAGLELDFRLDLRPSIVQQLL